MQIKFSATNNDIDKGRAKFTMGEYGEASYTPASTVFHVTEIDDNGKVTNERDVQMGPAMYHLLTEELPDKRRYAEKNGKTFEAIANIQRSSDKDAKDDAIREANRLNAVTRAYEKDNSWAKIDDNYTRKMGNKCTASKVVRTGRKHADYPDKQEYINSKLIDVVHDYIKVLHNKEMDKEKYTSMPERHKRIAYEQGFDVTHGALKNFSKRSNTTTYEGLGNKGPAFMNSQAAKRMALDAGISEEDANALVNAGKKALEHEFSDKFHDETAAFDTPGGIVQIVPAYGSLYDIHGNRLDPNKIHLTEGIDGSYRSPYYVKPDDLTVESKFRNTLYNRILSNILNGDIPDMNPLVGANTDFLNFVTPVDSGNFIKLQLGDGNILIPKNRILATPDNHFGSNWYTDEGSTPEDAWYRMQEIVRDYHTPFIVDKLGYALKSLDRLGRPVKSTQAFGANMLPMLASAINFGFPSAALDYYSGEDINGKARRGNKSATFSNIRDVFSKDVIKEVDPIVIPMGTHFMHDGTLKKADRNAKNLTFDKEGNVFFTDDSFKRNPYSGAFLRDIPDESQLEKLMNRYKKAHPDATEEQLKEKEARYKEGSKVKKNDDEYSRYPLIYQEATASGKEAYNKYLKSLGEVIASRYDLSNLREVREELDALLEDNPYFAQHVKRQLGITNDDSYIASSNKLINGLHPRNGQYSLDNMTDDDWQKFYDKFYMDAQGNAYDSSKGSLQQRIMPTANIIRKRQFTSPRLEALLKSNYFKGLISEANAIKSIDARNKQIAADVKEVIDAYQLERMKDPSQAGNFLYDAKTDTIKDVTDTINKASINSDTLAKKKYKNVAGDVKKDVYSVVNLIKNHPNELENANPELYNFVMTQPKLKMLLDKGNNTLREYMLRKINNEGAGYVTTDAATMTRPQIVAKAIEDFISEHYFRNKGATGKASDKE